MDETPAALPREIAAQQRRQIELSTEALELQRRHAARVEAQLDRADRINARAEALQLRAARIIRVVLFVLLPAAVLLLAHLAWPSLRALAG